MKGLQIFFKIVSLGINQKPGTMLYSKLKFPFSLVSTISLFTISVLMGQQTVNVQQSAYASYQVGLQGLGPDFGNNPASENFYSDMRIRFGKMGIEEKLELEDIDGSIYINEVFVLGAVYFGDEPAKNLYMRYNAFNDEIEIKESKSAATKTMALVKTKDVSCTMGVDKWNYMQFEDKTGSQSQGYLNLIYSAEEYKLYEQKRKLFKEGKQAKTSHATSFPHRFVDETNYYLSVLGATPAYINGKKADVVALFDPKKQNDIKKFLKQKKVSLKDKNGLVNLMAYANSL